MKIKIERQKRKTIALKLIDSRNAVLKVPLKLSQEKIDEFLESKKSWIEKNAKKLWQKENFSKSFDFQMYLYLNGTSIGKTNELVIGFDKLNVAAKRKAIQKYYLSLFPRVQELAREVSQTSGLGFDDVRPTQSRSIWGSYSSKKVMKLNWKLIILPEDLQKYVICHELSHSLHFNHSPKFWKQVEDICPDYKALRKRLKDYSFLLSGTLNI